MVKSIDIMWYFFYQNIVLYNELIIHLAFEQNI